MQEERDRNREKTEVGEIDPSICAKNIKKKNEYAPLPPARDAICYYYTSKTIEVSKALIQFRLCFPRVEILIEFMN